MSQKSLKELKGKIKQMGEHRREVYDLSQDPEKRITQVRQMVDRMEDAVEASRLEKLLLKGDKRMASVERKESAKKKKEQMLGQTFNDIAMTE